MEEGDGATIIVEAQIRAEIYAGAQLVAIGVAVYPISGRTYIEP